MATDSQHDASDLKTGDVGGRQIEVVEFLSDPANWHSRPERIHHIETHGAHVFLGGERAFKIKRAVRYDYMDFSTLELRRAVIERELELNRGLAPSLYLGTTAITREPDGRLAVGGSGPPVEWGLVMRRFDDRALLSEVARRGGLTPSVMKALAATVLAAHRQAATSWDRDPIADCRHILSSIVAGLVCASAYDPAIAEQAARLDASASAAIARVGNLLAKRRDDGFVRRCHGDLHLANIVLLDGQPTLFDALEFDEALGTIDTLYDLAFLLMDLDVRSFRPQANLLLGQYLWLSGDDADLDGLAALPLFLALRAAIRAMVSYQRRAVVRETGMGDATPEPGCYLDRAIAYLAPPPPHLIAIGGLSGTGKSTVAAALAPQIGACPGALHLRSDLERKRLAGVAEIVRLPRSAYTPEVGAEVYRRLSRRARAALAAGHAVIVDAVYQRAEERRAIEDVAREAGVSFTGLWLTAPERTMLARIRDRRDDASDATEDVARGQLARDPGTIAWSVVDASRDAAQTLALCSEQLPPRCRPPTS